MLDVLALKKCSCECVGPVAGSSMDTEDGSRQDHNNHMHTHSQGTVCVYFDCKTTGSSLATGRLLLYICFFFYFTSAAYLPHWK